MKLHTLLSLLALALWLPCIAGTAVGAPDLPAAYPDYCKSPTWMVDNHLRVGLRSAWMKLQDSKRNPDTEEQFLGSINELKLQSPQLPVLPYIQWLLFPCAGLELGWDQFRAKTLTSVENNHSDGTFELSGPTITAYLQYNNWTRLTPAVGLGVAFLNASFDLDPVWHNGFSYNNLSAYDAWQAAGSPPWPNNGYQRTITARDTQGLILSANCEIQLDKHLALDLFVRHMWADVDAHYFLSSYEKVTDDRGITKFPMSNDSAGLALKYVF